MLDKIWINAWQDMDQSLIPRLTTHKFGPRIFYKFKRGQYHHAYFFNLLRAVSVKPIFRIVGLNFVIFNWLQILGNIIWNKVIFKLPKISNIFARKNFKEYLKVNYDICMNWVNVLLTILLSILCVKLITYSILTVRHYVRKK